MFKEKRILSYVLGWLLVGFCILFIGVNNVFGATYNMNYEYLQKYYDNNGSTVTAVTTTWNESLQSYVSNNITTIANSYGAGLSITSPIPLIANHTYTLSVYFDGISNIAKSSKNNIAISTSLTGAASNYSNNNFYVDMIQSSVSNNTVIQFVFTTKGGGNYIFFPWTTTSNSTHSYVLTQISMEDLGSEGVSQDDINNSLNNQTNTLNQSIQNSTDTITGEINDMEQNIIDSNKETQEVIKDQFNTCRPSSNLLDLVLGDNTKGLSVVIDDDNIITLNGTATSNGSIYISNNFTLLGNEYYTLSSEFLSGTSNQNNATVGYWNNLNSSFYFIGSVGNKLTNKYESNLSSRFLIYVETGYTFENYKFKVWLNKGSISQPYEPYGEEICNNKIDETNDKLDGIKGALTDSSTPNLDGLENSIGWLPPGPVDSILNLPLTMLNSLTNSLTKTCTPLNLTLPYVNKNIQIPCLSAIFAQITGVNGLWTWVGAISSVLILYNYLLNLYAWVDRVLTLRAEFDEAMGADLANWGRL